MDEVLPIVRGEFVYRDAFFVDVGEGRRHARAAEAEITSLLTGKTAKDQVGHWYEAQLIHYGLQRSKVKDTAKVRLQTALNQGKLQVPPHISDMESQMKKEYAAVVRKAKKSTNSKDSEPITTPSKKRKNEDSTAESSKKTRISMNVGGIAINIEHGEASKAASKASTTSKSASKKAASTKADHLPPDQKSTQTTKQQKSKAAAEEESSDSPRKASKSKAGTKDDKQPPAKLKQAAKEPARAPPQDKAKLKAGPDSNTKEEFKVKSEPKVKKETTTPKNPPKIKPEPTEKQRSVYDSDADSFTGVYNLYSPELSERMPEIDDNFRLFLCVDENKVWAGFELGPKSGVLRIDAVHLGETVTFGWRARDSNENGRLTFGRGCFGEIELVRDVGQPEVHGAFYNLFDEPIGFQGSRRPGPLWCEKAAYKFQQEWDGFVSEAYGR